MLGDVSAVSEPLRPPFVTALGLLAGPGGGIPYPGLPLYQVLLDELLSAASD